MGIFDMLGDVVEAALEAPAQVAKVAVKTVVSIPAVAIKTVKGAAEGAKEAINELGELLDED